MSILLRTPALYSSSAALVSAVAKATAIVSMAPVTIMTPSALPAMAGMVQEMVKTWAIFGYFAGLPQKSTDER
eukprot:765802-Hanusia_phi.AAC.5